MHVQHLLLAGIVKFGVLELFDVDECQEDVGDEHVVLLFDSDLSSKVFSQAVHEAFNCIVVILFVAGVAHVNHASVEIFNTFDGEQWM